MSDAEARVRAFLEFWDERAAEFLVEPDMDPDVLVAEYDARALHTLRASDLWTVLRDLQAAKEGPHMFAVCIGDWETAQAVETFATHAQARDALQGYEDRHWVGRWDENGIARSGWVPV